MTDRNSQEEHLGVVHSLADLACFQLAPPSRHDSVTMICLWQTDQLGCGSESELHL